MPPPPREPLVDRAADRSSLLARWGALTRETLPAMAARHAWPIRLDHCFMRVCLDAALGARWDGLVARPAIRHLTHAQLERAITIAESIVADPALLAPLNDASLRHRGRATRTRRPASLRLNPTGSTTMDGDAKHDPAHEAYHTGLRNLHALEKMAIELAERQADRLEHYPAMRDKLLQHREESRHQAARLEQILSRHDASPSAIKSTVTSVMGNVAAALHGAAQDEVLKNTFANYAFEHQEIAAYTSLIAMAQAVGDSDAIPHLRQSLAEEQAMAAWIEAQIVPTTEKYLSLLQAGQKAGV